MGLKRPVTELIYISFLGSVASHIAGGGFENKPIENLATMMLALGLFVPRLILLAPQIRTFLRKPPPFQFFFVMQLLLMPMRFALGIMNGEPKIYIVTDLLLAATAVLIYVVSRAEYERLLPIPDEESFRGLYLTVLSMLFLGALPVTIASPGVVVTILGVVMVFLFTTSHRPKWQSLLGFLIAGLCLIHVPRALFLGIATVGTLMAFAKIFWKTILSAILIVVALAAYVIANFQTIPNLPPRLVQLGEIAQAAETIDWSAVKPADFLTLASVSTSIHERVWEAQQVIEALNNKGGFAWTFGMGYGTSLNFTDAPDRAVRNAARGAGLNGGGLVHNVHLIIFEQLLRFGLLGLSIFLWMGIRLLKVYWRCRKVVIQQRRVTFDMVCILTLIGSYVYFQFASDWDIAFVAFAMIGYLDARFVKIREGAAEERPSPPSFANEALQPG